MHTEINYFLIDGYFLQVSGFMFFRLKVAGIRTHNFFEQGLSSVNLDFIFDN